LAGNLIQRGENAHLIEEMAAISPEAVSALVYSRTAVQGRVPTFAVRLASIER
jgi:hypothetical protein